MGSLRLIFPVVILTGNEKVSSRQIINDNKVVYQIYRKSQHIKTKIILDPATFIMKKDKDTKTVEEGMNFILERFFIAAFNELACKAAWNIAGYPDINGILTVSIKTTIEIIGPNNEMDKI